MSSGLSGVVESEVDEIYRWADIILLRWITATVSDYKISEWTFKDKPVVWCLSDMAPFTGGCHYAGGCAKYVNTCEQCPIVKEGYETIPSIVLSRRKKIWGGNLTIVSPTKWLKDKAKESQLFSKYRIHVIQTGVELKKFFPGSRMSARAALNLKKEPFTLLFSANSVLDPRKGLNYLFDALNAIDKTVFDSGIQLLLIGKLESDVCVDGVDVVSLGTIDDGELMRLAYCASDIAVLPYVEDNLPNVMLESIASGTPVVAFASGGIPEVLIDDVNGFLVNPRSSSDLASAIQHLYLNPLKQADIRSWACKHLSIEDQGKKYEELFRELLQ